MKLDKHYTDPRLVALYDRDNPRGIDTDFYIQLASELNAQQILDLGCGTGTLTCELAIADRHIIGIDPSAAMLAVAREKPGAERVEWIKGDSSQLGGHGVDLAIMTGNVAQVFLDDIEWTTTLNALHAAIHPGGYLAFESRNPVVRAWESWGRDDTYEEIDTPFGPMTCWMDVLNTDNGIVEFVGYNVFELTGDEVAVSSRLCFRSEAELATSLTNSGFRIKALHGNWNKRPFESQTSQLMIFVAQRV
ncbi:MAG: class I SAM-dependent methyltransferase [Chloroflexota bacterium]